MMTKNGLNRPAIEGGQEPDELVPAPARSHIEVLHGIIARNLGLDSGGKADPSTTAQPAPPIERAIMTALGRTAQKLHDLAVYPESVAIGPISLSELPELLPEQALLAVIEGRKDALGVVALCPATIASLIEMLAVGRVSSRPLRVRKPTRTDAAITADFVGAFLRELGQGLSGHPAFPDFGGFRYASFLDDPRPLSLMLEDGAIMHLSIRFRIGPGGQRDGQILVAVPAPRAERPRDESRTTVPLLDDAAQDGDDPPPLSDGPVATISDKLQDAPIQLVGVLCRKTLSLAAIRELTAGSLLALPVAALDQARIETADGQFLAGGRLGEADGFHAIRLRAAGSPAPGRVDTLAEARTGDRAAPPSAPIAVEVDLAQPDDFRPPPDFRPSPETDAGAAVPDGGPHGAASPAMAAP